MNKTKKRKITRAREKVTLPEIHRLHQDQELIDAFNFDKLKKRARRCGLILKKDSTYPPDQPYSIVDVKTKRRMAYLKGEAAVFAMNLQTATGCITAAEK